MVTDLGQTAGLTPTAQRCTTPLVDIYTCNYKGYSGCLRSAQMCLLVGTVFQVSDVAHGPLVLF